MSLFKDKNKKLNRPLFIFAISIIIIIIALFFLSVTEYVRLPFDLFDKKETIKKNDIEVGQQLSVKINQGSHASTYLTIVNKSKLDFNWQLLKSSSKNEINNKPTWLNYIPKSGTISKNNQKKIEILINGKNLNKKKYIAYLFIKSDSLKDDIYVKLSVNVAGSPIIEMADYWLVDDGSNGTAGNGNQIANAGETVLLITNFNNSGLLLAREVKIKAKKLEENIEFIGSNLASLGNISSSNNTKSAKFLIYIKPGVKYDVPPALNFIIRDKDNNRWDESLYLKSEDININYPLGAVETDE